MQQIKCSKFPKKVQDVHKHYDHSIESIEAPDDNPLPASPDSSPKQRRKHPKAGLALLNQSVATYHSNVGYSQQHSPRSSLAHWANRSVIDFDNPLIKRQRHLEALYGADVREVSPQQIPTSAAKPLSISQLDELS